MTLPASTQQYYYPELGSYRNLVIQNVPLRSPKSNEVLVRTRAVSLQYRDLFIASGEYPGPVATNIVPCSDMAGEVITVGEDVKQWRAGDRVCANFMLDKIHDEPTVESAATALGGPIHGVLTEYRIFPAHSLIAIPSHLSYEEASNLPCAAMTAYTALFGGWKPTKAGNTILVQGTGGVSIFALQFAVASGATVIATSSSDEKLKLAKKLGAKHVINYTDTPKWDEEVLRLTNGLGVDRVIEVAGNATITQSIASARMGGCSDVPPPDLILPIIRKALKIRGSSIGSVPQFKEMIKIMVANPETTRPVIDKVFAFEEATEALAYVESQKHVGKVVVRI
ncbi:alcohol dehydrogenase superfamily protein [Mycena capillaripes]|nr:alcohol dehydrogenase superfamily protein [Mycena capillaripes]